MVAVEAATGKAGGEVQGVAARLLGRLAHEVRNPLSSLGIHVQLLEEDLEELPEALRERFEARLEIIHGEVRRLEAVVNQFLRLSKPTEARLELFEPGALVKQVCDLLGAEAAARQIRLTMRVEPGIPSLCGDRVQLMQALINLVVNAVQSVNENGKIDVSTARKESAVEFKVCDNGPGVSSENRHAIFEPYFTTRGEGIGLGLWIVQQIAQAHGGEVDVENLPAGGACFRLKLPVNENCGGTQPL